jgi:hypothetical protein
MDLARREKMEAVRRQNNDNTTSVAGSAGPSHCAAIAASVAEFVGVCCCRCCLNC